MGTPFFSVLYVTFFYVLKKERYVLLQTTENNERTLRSFAMNGKERKECSILLQRTEKNGTFFLKERKEQNVLLKKTEKNGKNGTFC